MMLKEFNQVHATYDRAKWLILKLFHPLVYERPGFKKGEGLREKRGGHNRGVQEDTKVHKSNNREQEFYTISSNKNLSVIHQST